MASEGGGRVHGHEANGVVEVARKVDTAAVENLVVKGEGGTFGVTFGQLDVGELPVISGGIGIGIGELVAFQRAFLTTDDGYDAVGAKGAVAIDGVGQGGLGLPSAEVAVKIDGDTIHGVLWSKRSVVTAGDDDLRVVHGDGMTVAGFGQAVHFGDARHFADGVHGEAIHLVGGIVFGIGVGATYYI